MSADLYNPIRDANPCKGCTERHKYCHDGCDRHSLWKAELERVNENRRRYYAMRDVGWRKKK